MLKKNEPPEESPKILWATLPRAPLGFAIHLFLLLIKPNISNILACLNYSSPSCCAQTVVIHDLHNDFNCIITLWFSERKTCLHL